MAVKLFDILENIYKNTTKTHEESNKTFTTTSRVRQIGPESSFLFDLYVDFAMRVYRRNLRKKAISSSLNTNIDLTNVQHQERNT